MAQHGEAPQPQAQPAAGLSPAMQAVAEIRRLRGELDQLRRGSRTPIAITGIALRLPGGITTPEGFWRALADGQDLIGTIPHERWDAGAYQRHGNRDKPGAIESTHTGFLAEVDAFDAEFFGIGQREAASMDPQHRILLELTWEALERAAIDPHTLMDSPTGVWIGLTNSDYARKLTDDARRIDGYTGIGAAGSIAAGRIAYFLGTHGSAQVIDTACSSALVAVHQAVRSLRQGETSLALVGGANLILSPEMHVALSQAGMLSSIGRCRTFDEAADGYVRSEGCCVVVLKRLPDAQRDRDPILAVIRGSAVNHDGRSAGVTAPNGPAQESVMRCALQDAGLSAEEVEYVEAHGTGTPLGDPMEVRALGAVYCAGRSRKRPLRVGSVKTNLGHTEAAAGMVGLIKVVLMMQPGRGIAPHIHFSSPSRKIDWQEGMIQVPVTLTPWSADAGNKYAGVSSFGFSGTNAHVIIESPDPEPAARPNDAQAGQDSLLCISAHGEASLRELARRYALFLRESHHTFEEICMSAATRRARLPYRLALRAKSAVQASALLEEWAQGNSVPGLVTSESEPAAEGAKLDILESIARDFVSGGALQYGAGGVRPVPESLPVYPFQRRRLWFGGPLGGEHRREAQEVWISARHEAVRQSGQGPLGWNPRQLKERWASLDRLTIAHARNVLATAGAFSGGTPASVDEVMQHCGFLPIYRRLVARWLGYLANEGQLIAEGNRLRPSGKWECTPLDSYWRDAERHLSDDPGMLAYLKRCGTLLPEVLAGRANALETLFPDGSFALAEAIYANAGGPRFLNAIIASAVRSAVKEWGRNRNARVLELGGGTGGTTAAVLPGLPPEKTEYWFTDVSDLFLSRARKKFEEYGFVRYRQCDLDGEVEEAGLPAGGFDVVIAANVVHVARNVHKALRRIHRLLMPGGILVMLEVTQHQTCSDMSIGLTEGWQHFEDDERGDHPLLDPGQWRSILMRTGFEEIVVLPDDHSPASLIGQHVLLASRSFSDQAIRERSEQGTPLDAVQHGSSRRDENGDLSAALVEIHNLPEAIRREAISGIVREKICKVLNLELPPNELGERDRLTDLGMDSLIALELRGELARVLGLEGKVPKTIAFDSGTVGELTRLVSEIFARESDSQVRELFPLGSRTSIEVSAGALLAMTDEEVERLVKERFARR
jgi:3-oxoacyl-(acyl-carrier-protein) synthase/SAM-dependent methyltransferase